MYNSWGTVGGQIGNKGTKATGEALGVNKSMINILAQGVGTMVAGAIKGFTVAGPAGALIGGTFGMAVGLTTGTVLESTGTYKYIEKKLTQ